MRIKPGTPIPSPAKPPSPKWARKRSISMTISPTTAVGPASIGVAPAIRWRISPARLIAAARKFVPPRSTPIEYVSMRKDHSRVVLRVLRLPRLGTERQRAPGHALELNSVHAPLTRAVSHGLGTHLAAG